MEAIDIPITTDANGNAFLELLAMNEEAIYKLELDAPLTHALIVVTYQGKFHLQADFHGPERIEYGALYAATLDNIAAFQENEEAARIAWWDGESEIGDINEIDRKLTEYA